MIWNILKLLFLIPVLLVKLLLKSTTPAKKSTKPVIAFFHPYCNDGGGGERVLWSLVRVAQLQFKEECIYQVFHGDIAVSSSDILRRTKERFGIELPGKVEFVLLKRRKWVESGLYPVLTMFGQALGSVVLGCDALLQADRKINYIFDTMGYAFAYPVFHYFGKCKILCYTHYPVISTDMLERVVQRRPSYNNDSVITKSVMLSSAKSLYYRMFAKCYGMVGRYAALVMVNSKWTANHIKEIWKCPVSVVYPAVDTANVENFAFEGREDKIISISQFRPEKDHILQIQAFAEFAKLWKEKFENKKKLPKLTMIGSVRNVGDELVVAKVREQAKALGLKEGQDFEFAFNVTYKELLDYFKRSRVGLHTMWNEHFGIGVVELMAAGVVTIAHNSGGPKMDILAADSRGNRIGYLAASCQEYALAMMNVFCLREEEERSIQERARIAMKIFSESSFEKTVRPLIENYIRI